MKIPILSDTHDDIVATKKVLEDLKNKGFKQIIHLGDFSAPFMIDLFKDFKVFSVLGNNDGDIFSITNKMNSYNFSTGKVVLELELEGKKIILYHGTTPQIRDALVTSQEYDFVLHGHTHKLRNEKIGKTTVLNPGTINKDLSQENISSYMILDLKTKEVEIVKS